MAAHSEANSASPPTAKPPCAREDALAVLDRLRAAGHLAYFAGGCVRDSLLGREPKDWDVATDAPPDRVRAIFANTQAVGAAFGVILVRHRKSVVEVATFRADAEYIDGRHPTGVRFTTAEEDARRRDFTINGLFLDPHREGPREAQVIDYVGGRRDIADRVIRAIGVADERFNEDHLRLLRAVRFAARFDFAIEPATAAAIRRHAPQLIRISPERIADELRIMLTPASRGRAYQVLEELNIRAAIFRFLDLPKGEGRLPKDASVFHLTDHGTERGTGGPPVSSAQFMGSESGGLPEEGEDTGEPPMPQRPVPQPISFALALAAASVDHYLWTGPANADVRRLFEKPIAQKIVRALRQSLKISNDESDEILGILTGLEPLLAAAAPSIAAVKRFLARPTADGSRRLLSAAAALGLLDADRVQMLETELARLEQTDYAPPPFITGDDLTAAGLSPGPVFKRVLDAVYDAQLENRIANRDEAMALALKLSGS